MIIDCIADLHGYYPQLNSGDMLIVAGDLTASDRAGQYFDFEQWLDAQQYQKKVIIAGNHDNFLVENGPHMFDGSDYLCDSGTEYQGLKIWGSPWTKTFEGMNHRCKAFTFDTEEELERKWALIRDDTDILITHGPQAACLDKTIQNINVGSSTLANKIGKMRKMRLHVFGHIHEAYGYDSYYHADSSLMRAYVNCSHVNERYQPVNKPIRIVL